MLFNSLSFAFFFPLVTISYFLLPHRTRWALLLVASCLFYAFFIPKYLLVLFALILIDYASGIAIERAHGRRRRALLILSLVSNLGLLFFFKYLNFFSSNVAAGLNFLGIPFSPVLVSCVLPIGLSFHTFQSMAYTIEVFKGRQIAERDLGIYALYVLFYPQLVAGPIERPQNLLPQFRAVHQFDYARIVSGLKLMAGGLIKKMVIADRLAVTVNLVYKNPEAFDGWSQLMATWLFAFQIYGDFSGYSDIARGAARVMGFDLMQNFNHPYAARSFSEFWRRWHISLSSWFRDYVYLPLGGNRGSEARTLGNIFIVFLLSGLWHGASWNFVVWGSLHGLYLAVGRLCERKELSSDGWLKQAVQTFLVFNLVSLAWVFFRAATLPDALLILRGVFTSLTGRNEVVLAHLPFPSVCVGLILCLEFAQWYQRRGDVWEMVSSWPVWVRWPVYYACVAAILLLGPDSQQSFIYFQF